MGAKLWRTMALAAVLACGLGLGGSAIVTGGYLPRAGAPDDQAVIVYVTRTGAKYHRESCRSLKKSKSPLPLADAKKSYQPCKICTPPQ